MSEYQYVYFAAVDKPLNDEQLKFMKRQATRAKATRLLFQTEYHYGDFNGDSFEMLCRGYDVHLHYANFGIRKLMFRLPLGLPISAEQFQPYENGYGIEWQKDQTGIGGVLSIEPEGDADSYSEDYDDCDRMSTYLPKIRDSLIAGDLRTLYLGWLACDWNLASVEPPVPAGLGTLPTELTALVDFLGIDRDLLANAIDRSPA